MTNNSIKKFFEFIDKPSDIYERSDVTLELIREAELKLMKDPLIKNLYYPCLCDVCEETGGHYVSASVGQRLRALAIVKDWDNE